MISKPVHKVKVFGGITLNISVGGMNQVAVERVISYGEGNPGGYGKMIRMPTVDAVNHVRLDERPDDQIVHLLRNGRF